MGINQIICGMIDIKLMGNQVTNMRNRNRNQATNVYGRSVFAEMDEQMRMDKVESAVHQLTFIHKVFLIRDQGFGLDDGLFYGWFTEEEESLLFQLEDGGWLDTKGIRLLG